MEKKPYLECGKIIATHGIRGGAKVECWCDSPKVLCQLKTVYRESNGQMIPMPVVSASVYRDMGLMIFEGLSTPEAIMPLKGTVLFAKREDIPLPEGAILLADMMGIPIIDIDSGKIYGILKDVNFAPASPIYTIKTVGGGEVLFPAVPEFVKEVDAERGIFIRPIPGFFDEV